MPYTVLIVDDESLARQVIRNYLKAYPDFSIIGECDNGKDAVEMIDSLSPDIVFLDIQIPELSGMEVIERLDVLPHIIFSTAYDEYAIRAFEINAVDYLLKPYDKERFDKSIMRVRQQLQKGFQDIDQISALLDSFHKPQSYLERILVPQKEQLIFVQVKDIIYIESLENYVSIVTLSGSHLLFQKISDVEVKLNPQNFFRIHRSYIVNLNHVKTVETWLKSNYKVVLKNGKELPLSRRRVKDFKNCFGL